MRKDFQGLSPTKEVVAEMSTHLVCKRLHYILSVNWIHTRVFFSVNQIQTISYDQFYDSHSSNANGQMTYYDWSILSIPSTSMKSSNSKDSNSKQALSCLISTHFVLGAFPYDRYSFTWRNRRLPSPTRINSFLCQLFHPSVRAKRGIWSKRVLIRKIGNFSFSVR